MQKLNLRGKKVNKIDEKLMENDNIKNLNLKFLSLKNARKNQNKIENEKISDPKKKSQNITNYMNQRVSSSNQIFINENFLYSI
jgi:hypothetical protein